jgi:hypothetical protein
MNHAYLAIHCALWGRRQDNYIVLDDFGWIGCIWHESEAGSANRETLIRALFEGEFSNPIRIVIFNTAEGWSRDVTMEIADELRRRLVEFGEVPESILGFMDANRR